MTLPFENDTRAVVKRLSNRNITANRKRNIFTILTMFWWCLTRWQTCFPVKKFV